MTTDRGNAIGKVKDIFSDDGHQKGDKLAINSPDFDGIRNVYSPNEGTARADMCSVNNYSTLSPTDLSYYQR